MFKNYLSMVMFLCGTTAVAADISAQKFECHSPEMKKLGEEIFPRSSTFPQVIALIKERGLTFLVYSGERQVEIDEALRNSIRGRGQLSVVIRRAERKSRWSTLSIELYRIDFDQSGLVIGKHCEELYR